MKARKRLAAVSLGVAGVVLPLAAAGTAFADDTPTEGVNSTQNPLQAVTSLLATGGQSGHDIQDVANGYDRPDGANGNETELPSPDPRFVEGPLSGLLDDPFG